MPSEALITPNVLYWARLRARLSIEELAGSLGVDAERLRGWEAGEARPSLPQAKKIARILRLPFGYLFLSESPVESLPLPDLRTLGNEVSIPSPDLFDLLVQIMAKQDWYRSYLEEEGAPPLPFIGRYADKQDVDAIARSIRGTLRLTEQTRAEASSRDDFLRTLSRNAEDAGILVLRSGVVGNDAHRPLSVAEFRGLAIADDLAPLIFINTNDAKNAQIFTLVHELAHLWVGVSGISNPNYKVASRRQIVNIERICNRVAAEVLVPAESFLVHWLDSNDIELNLDRLSRRYKVSRFVVLRQALDLAKIDANTYSTYYERLLGQSGPSGWGGNFYFNIVARHSGTFTRALLTAVAESRLQILDAAKLLSVKVSTIESLVNRMVEGEVGA